MEKHSQVIGNPSDAAHDHRWIAAPETLNQLAELAGVETSPGHRSRAAHVVLFATNSLGVTRTYLQHIQDLEWVVPESALLRDSATMMNHFAKRNEDAGRMPPA
jgi:hypothetical protein